MGTITGYLNPRGITWREIPGIYKARFRHLWHVLWLNIVAASIILAALVLMPLIFGIAVFSGHLILSALALVVVFAVSVRFYWLSFKQAFNIK